MPLIISGGGGGGGSGTSAVDSVNTKTGIVVINPDDLVDTATTNKFVTAADKTLLGNTSGENTGDDGTVTSVAVTGSDGIEVDSGTPITSSGTIALGVNKVTMLSTLNVADGATANSSDATLLARANHTGTQTASTISDFDAEVSNNTDVDANTTARHTAVTVSDTSEIDLTLTGQEISASIVAASIDETKLDTSVNASLDLADNAIQDISGKADKSNVLELDNTIEFTPDANYEPATKKYVDDTMSVGSVSSVNTETGAVVLDADDISDASTANKFVTVGDITKLSNLSNTNTGDNTVCTSGAATTAETLKTARNIAGVSFNGSANISLNNNAITNGAGYTTNAGTVTSVTGGTGLTSTGGAIPSVSHDSHTGDATGSTALTLATVNSNVGTFTNPSVTVNGKGLITAASTGIVTTIKDDETTPETFVARSGNILITDATVAADGESAPSWSASGDIILIY